MQKKQVREVVNSARSSADVPTKKDYTVDDIPGWAIAMIVIGVLVGIGGVAGIVWYYKTKQ